MAVQINVAANQAALTASIQAGVQAYNQRFAQNNQINLSINQRGFSQPLGRITGDVKDFEAALAASNARVIAFGASTAVLGGVIRSFKELANVTIEVEKNLADINRVFGLTTSQLQKFSTDLFNVTKLTASSFDDASKAALEFSRQGLKAEDTLQRTKDALTLTRLAGISTANAVDALTSTVNGFASTGISTTQILNKLVAVEQDYAVGAGDLAEALSRTGQAAQEAGVSLDQLNALVTSAQQSTARGGAVIGNALKTIFTRLQRTDTLDQLEAFNISVRDVQGNILPAVQILQNFAGAYKGLADAQRAQLSEQVAGVYQVNILKAIVNDLNKSQGTYAGALQRGAAATNEAEVATAKLNQTLDALLKQTATSTQQLANNIGKVTFEPLAKYGTEQLKSFIESLNEVLEGEGVGSTFANGLLKGIRNVIAGPGAIAAFFTLFKLIQNSFTYLSQALPQIAGITTETQNRKNIEQSILQIMQQQGPVSQALAGTMGNQAAQAQLLLQLARQQTAEYQMQTTLAKQLAVQLAGQGVRVKGSGGLQVTRAGGYIPNATKMAEVVGAQAGGYTPGRVVSSPVGGVMNTAEDVKYIPGFAQPFINPPANSKAGRAHRQKAISRTGVDPYMYGGFIPNFSNPKDVINKSYTGPLHLLQIHSLDEKEEIQKVADLETEITKRGKKQVINDKITGFGIKYVTEEIKGKSNSDYRKEAADLALSGDIEAIKKSMPKTKGSSFNATQWRDNLKDLNDKGINLYLSNIENLSRLKNAVPSLITGKTVEFGRQFTGLLNALSGEAFEKDIAKQKKKLFARSEKSNARLDFESLNQSYSGGEAKLGGITLGNLVAKAIESTGRKYDNGDEDKIAFSKPIKLFVPEKHKLLNKGFIPNFAPPTSAIRIPWFKKFGNPAFDAIQPALGISKASDVETFRQINFKSTAEGADEGGDSNIFAPLFEDFAFKAMQLVSQQDVKDDLIRGYVLQPGTNQKQSAFDGALEKLGIGLEYKGYPKKNLTGSITGELTRKYKTLSKTNPAAAAKLKELIIAFNEVGHENQITSELGKKLFSPLAGVSYSQMVKNSPDLVKGLSAETNSLLNSYVKNPAFLAMASASGFIPNFAYKQEVMGLEESMSGNKAIFDTKPFPHIRNSSQPTFSSAIADHGGLGNALSDSMRGQKAAGLMSGGFIPNFVRTRQRNPRVSGNLQLETMDPSVIGSASGSPILPSNLKKNLIKSVNDIIKEYSDGAINQDELNKRIKSLSSRYQLTQQSEEKLQNSVNKQTAAINNNQSKSDKFAKSLASAGTAISIAGPMLAGQIEQMAFGNRDRTDMTSGERFAQSALSTGLTAVTTGVGIGASFGPIGAAIGGLSGLLIGLATATDAAKLSIEDLNKINEKYFTQQSQNLSSSQEYIQSQQQLNDLISKGASNEDIQKASKNLAENFSKIKDVNLQKAFIETGGDLKKMDKVVKEFTDNLNTQKLTRGIIASTKDLSGFSNYWQSVLSFFGGKTSFDVSTNLDTENINNLISALSQINVPSNRLQFKGKSLANRIQEAKAEYSKTTGVPAEKVVLDNLDDIQNQFASEFAQQNSDFINELTEKAKFANEEEKQKYKEKIGSLLARYYEFINQGLSEREITQKNASIVSRLSQTAVQSFSQIFKIIENQFKDLAFNIAMDFEKNSAKNRVENILLDFTTNFNDEMSSFVLKNLPDLDKFRLAPIVARQKKESSFRKLSLESSDFEIKQARDRSLFLMEGAQNLTKNFKEQMLDSEQNAKYFLESILPDLKQGNYDVNVGSVAQKMFERRQKDLIDYSASLESRGLGITSVSGLNGRRGAPLDLNNPEMIRSLQTSISQRLNIKDLNPKDREDLIKLNDKLILAERASAFLRNQNAQDEINNALKVQNLEKIKFDLIAENARKEFELNQTLSKERMKAQEIMAVEEAKIQSENLIRTKSMEAASKRLGFGADLFKAQREGRISDIERNLSDPRLEAGLGVKEITERRIKAEREILEERRKIEDQALATEIAQAQMQLLAEIQNTNALEQLTKAVLAMTSSNLITDLGGQDQINRIEEYIRNQLPTGQLGEATSMRDINFDVDREFGKGSYGKYLAYKRNEEQRQLLDNNAANIANMREQLKKSGNFKDEQLTYNNLENLAKQNPLFADQVQLLKEQYDKRKQILDIQRSSVDKDQAQKDALARLNASFIGNMALGLGGLRKEGDDMFLKLGRDLPRMFADGMVDGIKAVIRESDNLGDALMGIASKFLDEISTTLMRSGMYQILGSIGMGIPSVQTALGGKQKGGVIRAQNGMFVSGTGSGDKYPALLENGEYVLNRRAVMAMGGPAALDTLNFSMAPRFASGGSFGFDLASSKSDAENIAKMESLMTSEGLENSPLYKELSDAEKQRREEDRKKRLARKQQRAALIGQFAAAGITLAIGAGLSNVMKNTELTKLQKISDKMQSNPYGYKFTASEMKLYNKGVSKGMLSPSGQLIGAGMNTPRTGISSVLSPKAFIDPRRQTGGLIGSRLSDTIPGYMEGGLYSSSIVKKYGTGMQGGGSSIMAAGNNSSTVNNNTNANNSFNFNTTVQRDGTIKMGANTTSYQQQDVELSKNLNAKMYAVVTEVIRKEKQFGGSLAGIRN